MLLTLADRNTLRRPRRGLLTILTIMLLSSCGLVKHLFQKCIKGSRMVPILILYSHSSQPVYIRPRKRRAIQPMLCQCLSTDYDASPTFTQHYSHNIYARYYRV